MTTFFINVFIAVFTNEKVQAMLKDLLAPLISDAEASIKAEVNAVGDKLLAQVQALPAEILGDASKDVGVLLHEITGSTSDIAGAVKGEVSPLLDPVGFAKAIVAQMVGVGGQKPPWWPF